MIKALWILLSLLIATPTLAQDWQHVLSLPQSSGSSAFFFNALEGFIGTGNYFGGSLAHIFFTTDGGATWQTSRLPNPGIVGQVTDIYFYSADTGWATIAEANATGWSGVYRSVDRGRSWKLMVQAGFPSSVRATSRGVYYVDRDVNPGVLFSSDGGANWRAITALATALSIDFLDADHAFVTSQAYGSPPHHLQTMDGGATWVSIPTNLECWGVLADREQNTYFLANEQNNSGMGPGTGLLRVGNGATSETQMRSFPAYSITGGIGANPGCGTYLYVQTRHPVAPVLPGLMRSSDGGVTWVSVGGPCNRADTRFAVTGRGAVVFAFDSVGGVWKTATGGDRTLSPYVMPMTRFITTTASAQAAICDSVTQTILLSYSGCDSISVHSVTFADDTLGELVLQHASIGRYAGGGRRDTIIVTYRPKAVRTWNASVRITIAQPDGFLEDTTLQIRLIGVGAHGGAIHFAALPQLDTLSFDSVALCSVGSKAMTLINSSCADAQITSLRVTGPFTLRSAFRPFVLSADGTRSFLLEYEPSGVGTDHGALIASGSFGIDTLALIGTGYTSATRLVWSAPDTLVSSVCDSTSATFALNNATCSELHTESLAGSAHLVIGFTADSISAGGSSAVTVGFHPTAVGSGSDTLRLSYEVGGAEYDTTLVIAWRATAGAPLLVLSDTTIDFGTISTCALGTNRVVDLLNAGCGDLNVVARLDDSLSGFRIVDAPEHPIGMASSDSIVVRFVPTGGDGAVQTVLRLQSGAISRRVVLRAMVSSDAGGLEVAAASVDTTLLCEATGFSIGIHNTTCDTIRLVSESLQDGVSFVVTPVTAMLARDSSAQIPIVFAPIDSLVQSDDLTLHFIRADGSAYDTVVHLAGYGRPVPAVAFGVSPKLVNATSGSVIDVPIFALNPSTSAVETATFELALNSNVLSPIGIEAGVGSFGGASVTSITPTANGVRITLRLPASAMVPAGEFCAVRCESYVSDTFATSVRLVSAELDDATGASACVPATAALDSAMQFALAVQCGDAELSSLMAGRSITIERIAPNPTSGELTIELRTQPSYENDCVLEVLDALGHVEQRIPLTFGTRFGKQELKIRLAGSEGARYFRIVTPSGGPTTTTRRAILQK